MRLLLIIILWCLLLAFCWPLAILVLVALPVVLLIALVLRLMGIVLETAFATLRAALLLPARILMLPFRSRRLA